MSSDEAIDEALADYRKQLLATAELAEGDLDEIEDHLRALTDDLRSTGMSAAAAIAEAARRLGDPISLASEHARVRSPFGGHLSRLRAWSATALLLPYFVFSVLGIVQMTQFEPRIATAVVIWRAVTVAISAALTIALVARRSWAGPLWLGILGFRSLMSVVFLVFTASSNLPRSFIVIDCITVVCTIGMLAFLWPRRRAELTVAGLSLALQSWARCTAGVALNIQILRASLDHQDFLASSAIAFGATWIATGAAICRARWQALASAVSALALFVALLGHLPVEFYDTREALQGGVEIAMLFSGIIAAGASSLLARRQTRSMVGSITRYLRSA